MKLKSRPANGHIDYMALRHMLIDQYKNDPLNRNWSFDRMEWVRYHYYHRKNMTQYQWADFCHIWENEEKELVGAVLFEVPGFCSFQIHPSYEGILKREEMIQVAEEMHRKLFLVQHEKDKIEFQADERDTELIDFFLSQGYEMDQSDYMISYEDLDLSQDFPPLDLPEGYTLRSVFSPQDYLKKEQVNSAGFNVGDKYAKDCFFYLPEAPGYYAELDLIIEYGDRFVADCAGWYDHVNKRGVIEPLAVHPDFHKKGLGKAIIYENFRRMHALGAQVVDMHSSEKNRAFYTSIGYKPMSKIYFFSKKL